MITMSGGARTKGIRKITDPAKPLISIITAVRNGKKHLDQTIQSVISQSYDNDKIEYLIIDGGSTDGTLDIIRKYEDKVDHWVSEPDKGIYDAMNKGIMAATGDLIAFLNSDDWYLPGALEEVANTFVLQGDRRSVIAGRWNLVFEDIDLTVTVRPTLKFHAGMPLSHQAMFVPKRVYATLGGYDLQYRYAADLDMALRLFTGGMRFILLDTVIASFRTSGASEKYYRESGKEASRVTRNYLPYISYLRFRLVRIKFEFLNFLLHVINRIFGEKLSGRLKRRYFSLKSRYSDSWEIR
jgi:glycosyltransferase involved in cell wall biosynthesis